MWLHRRRMPRPQPTRPGRPRAGGARAPRAWLGGGGFTGLGDDSNMREGGGVGASTRGPTHMHTHDACFCTTHRTYFACMLTPPLCLCRQVSMQVLQVVGGWLILLYMPVVSNYHPPFTPQHSATSVKTDTYSKATATRNFWAALELAKFLKISIFT